MEALPLINSKPQLISRLSNFKVTREQVVQVLKDLRIDKSPGIDGIHPHILKELSDSISYPLSLNFQNCLKSGIIPQQWKDAIIAPIFKKGDRSLAKNYRPVSLTSVICKVLEKIIVIQISEHLKTNGLTCPAQHGFKAGHSTVTNSTGSIKCVDRGTYAQTSNRRYLFRLCKKLLIQFLIRDCYARYIVWVSRVPPLISSEHFLQADDRELG